MGPAYQANGQLLSLSRALDILSRRADFDGRDRASSRDRPMSIVSCTYESPEIQLIPRYLTYFFTRDRLNCIDPIDSISC